MFMRAMKWTDHTTWDIQSNIKTGGEGGAAPLYC